jgi:hypothetical protein
VRHWRQQERVSVSVKAVALRENFADHHADVAEERLMSLNRIRACIAS